MIPVSEARDKVLSLVEPLGAEDVPLARAAGRVLARDVTATRDQPPFAASSMDGYAVKSAEVERDAMFRVIGESAAGARFEGSVGPGEAVRIFTGAPIPDGADYVVIQEDMTRRGDVVTITGETGDKTNIRPAGVDFRAGHVLPAPRVLTPQDLALLAAMNHPSVPCTRRPVFALVPTGDELVMPGEEPGPDQIVASNIFGLKAMLEAEGAVARLIPAARDTEASLRTAFEMAKGADVIVTIGGASVGDHDLVGAVAGDLGMERSFYKIAMRPGKPLMAGRMGEAAMVGLPGNPVSAIVCGSIFLLPMIRRMLGRADLLPPLRQAPLARAIGENGPREHYMRAQFSDGYLTVFENQDSSLLSVLEAANALVVRQPRDQAREEGEMVDYLPL